VHLRIFEKISRLPWEVVQEVCTYSIRTQSFGLIKTDRVFYVVHPSLVESLSFLLPLQANFKLSYHQDAWTTSLVTLRKERV
jgi:hypothetical protein